MDSLRHRLLRLLDDVATIPRRDSVVWQGRLSLLACLTFFGVFLARLASPLQWIKWLGRRRQRLSDRGSSLVRPDFHALGTELYFLAILAVLLSFRQLLGEPAGAPSFLDRVVGAFFLFEIVVWVLYYGTLRGFIERTYSIYHRTEYLLMVPLAFLVCVASYSLLSGTAHSTTALMFLGGGNPNTIIGQSVNVLLFVVVVSYLVAQFPAASVKSDAVEAAKQRMTVIGAGDVIEQRALPALLKLGFQAKDIRLLAKSERPAGLAAGRFPGDFQTVDDDEKKTAAIALAARNPILIATPTLSHVPLVKALAAAANETLAPHQRLPLILEKPLCGPGQLPALREAFNSYGITHLFALSYYQLEKALPLVFILTADSGYLPYLHFTRGESQAAGKSKSWTEFTQRRLELGRLLTVSGSLLEGAERSQTEGERQWVLDPLHGGVGYELMIHLLVLAHIALKSSGGNSFGLLASARPKIEWLREASAAGKVESSWPTGMRIVTTVDRCKVELEAGKYLAPDKLRRAFTLTYQHYRIESDFDQRTASVYELDGRRRFTVGIREDFADKYLVQMDLVRRFIDRGFWSWNRTDGLEEQLAVLEWLDSHVNLRPV